MGSPVGRLRLGWEDSSPAGRADVLGMWLPAHPGTQPDVSTTGIPHPIPMHGLSDLRFRCELGATAH